MMLFVFALILAAAFLHAGWNALAKTSKDMVALMWWATLLSTIGCGIWLLSGLGIYLDPRSFIPFAISAAAETGYFVTLVRGYSQGDLSMVYPLSRGSAPIFAAMWSIVIGERLPWTGYVGIGLMVAGVYIASLPVDRSRMKLELPSIATPLRNGAVWWALASGVFIAIYSVSDKVAVVATPPLIYNWWVFAGNTVFWMPVMWRRFRFSRNFEELRKNWPSVTVTSLMMFSAYAAALAALAITSASYVVAGRGFSVVIGALIGSLILKESFGSARITGAALMVAGLALVALT
jgi:drug/metabolite transporter (DMT)-like permease